MIRLLDEDCVDALASSELGLAAARDTARLVAAREFTTGRLQIGDQHAWMRILVGLLPGVDLMGYKEFHRVGKDVRYHVHLFRNSTGEALGIVDGRRITSLRTSSTAALPFQKVFGERSLALAVIGSGEEAREGLRALAAAVSVDRACVFSPTPANRNGYAELMSAELGIPVRAAASVQEAIAGADAAYVATAATSPVVHYDDVKHLPLVAAVGATRPDHHELAGDVVARAASVIVDCEDALHEPGDMQDARRMGWDGSNAAVLGDWLEQAPNPGGGMLLFKSIGSVEQDLVLAHRLLVAGAEQDLGNAVEPVCSVRVMR